MGVIHGVLGMPEQLENRCSRCGAENAWDGRSLENTCADCASAELDASSDWARDEALLTGEG